jgi:hypothetical protein
MMELIEAARNKGISYKKAILGAVFIELSFDEQRVFARLAPATSKRGAGRLYIFVI